MAMSVFLHFFLLISPCLTVTSDSYDDLWISYKVKYKKTYDDLLEGFRRKVWERNVSQIAKHNLEADLGLHSYQLGLNKFTDMTTSEMDSYRKCLSHGDYAPNISVSDIFKCDYDCFASLPKQVDWREKGFVTPIKDQKDCGSCWAFSATGSLEGQTKAKTGVLVSLSEQNLVDCSWKQGNNGCDGGWMDYAFQYVIDNNGTDTEKAYPYKARNGHCKFVRSGVGAKCRKYIRIRSGSEKDLQAAVAKIGPISVAIDASGDNFMSYKKGIYTDKTCTPDELDHGVLVVGYGEMNGTPYWIVKNSWGTSWGMDGYILMRRNFDNMCGIATHAVYPVV